MTHRERSVARKAGAADLSLVGLAKSYGAVAVVRGISLNVAAGTIVSLIGPSGCGKTTTLRMIAGLEQPDDGDIIAGGRILTRGKKGEPPEARDLGMVFQTYALWPHMTVAANVAFGLKQRRWPSVAIGPKVAEVLGIVGMARFAERYPSQLSGGQQQRVALARAIATEPSILLFDEPLSNLDAVLREQMRFEIRALQQRLGITSVYVTHSQDEALAISDEIAVMRDGLIVQTGNPLSIYNTPRDAFVASFIGLANIITLEDASAASGVVTGRVGAATLISAARGGAGLAGRSRVPVCVRPIDLTLRLQGDRAADTNALAGTVVTATFTGGLVDYFVAMDYGSHLRVQGLPPIAAAPGDAVTVTVSPERVVVLEE